MWKRSLYFLAFLAIVLAASSCEGLDNSQVRLGEEFCLSIGQGASITAENLQVGFKEVIEDSRCPRGVTCIWAGRVSCVIELTHASASYRMVLTQPGLTDEYARERYEGYELAFYVTPYPEAGKQIAKDTYRLHLLISKLPEKAPGHRFLKARRNAALPGRTQGPVQGEIVGFRWVRD